jgi:hypothetical protein
MVSGYESDGAGDGWPLRPSVRQWTRVARRPLTSET